MKITGSHSHPLQSLLPGHVERSQGNGSDSTSGASLATSDSVELSQNAQFLQRVVEEVKYAEGTSAARLAALREQVQNGKYQPPVEDLATILMKELF
ncbi:MAG: flagellar biosynthesis anti-sigma factor FlgM [Gammaproteobacteria bacterium]|nr:MAG: flagellar biosynthesis anti-sigma factor FlgM [Gammaproteobacteria bacterium]